MSRALQSGSALELAELAMRPNAVPTPTPTTPIPPTMRATVRCDWPSRGSASIGGPPLAGAGVAPAAGCVACACTGAFSSTGTSIGVVPAPATVNDFDHGFFPVPDASTLWAPGSIGVGNPRSPAG